MENEHMEINWKMFIAPILILFLFIGGILGIINWQKSGQKAPTVTVNLPEGTTQSTEKEIVVSGKVDEGDKVWVNGEETKVGDDGSYAKMVTLKEGDNKITVKAENKAKKTVSTERTVKYTAAATPSQPGMSQAPATPEKPAAPATAPTPQASAPAASPAQSNLSTSGPEEIVIPVIGAGGIVLVLVYYFKSRKQLANSIRKH